MNFVKRIALFLALNFLVVLTVSLILGFLGIGPHATVYGFDLQELALFCLVWGMAGALISLSLSRVMAKWMMGVHVIDPLHCTAEQRRLFELVERLAEKAHLSKTPEVGIYNSPEVNAFATGPTKSRSLIAVSSGLLNRMNEKELEGVLAHEMAHIANGDMVTMTLLQGVVNAFVMFLARVLAFAISSSGKNERRSSDSYASTRLLIVLFEFIFMLLGSLLIAAYSRFREFRADAGGAHIAGRHAMVSALKSLQQLQDIQDPRHENAAIAAFKIAYKPKKGFLLLFATHPPLEERIERLEQIG